MQATGEPRLNVWRTRSRNLLGSIRRWLSLRTWYGGAYARGRLVAIVTSDKGDAELIVRAVNAMDVATEKRNDGRQHLGTNVRQYEEKLHNFSRGWQLDGFVL